MSRTRREVLKMLGSLAVGSALAACQLKTPEGGPKKEAEENAIILRPFEAKAMGLANWELRVCNLLSDTQIICRPKVFVSLVGILGTLPLQAQTRLYINRSHGKGSKPILRTWEKRSGWWQGELLLKAGGASITFLNTGLLSLVKGFSYWEETGQKPEGEIKNEITAESLAACAALTCLLTQREADLTSFYGARGKSLGLAPGTLLGEERLTEVQREVQKTGCRHFPFSFKKEIEDPSQKV